MKDSFIFEGKKYISARRASEISDYSSDYIGQLCRGGKLDCRMVGRSWFVTEESLHLHKANVLHDEIYRNRIQNLRGGKKDSQKTSTSESTVSVPAHESSVPVQASSQNAVVTETSPVAAQTLVVTSAPVVSSLTVASIAIESLASTLSYEADSGPLLPIADEKTSVESPYIVHATKTAHIPEEKFEHEVPIRRADVSSHVVHEETYPEIARGVMLKRALNIALILVVVAGISMGALIVHGVRTRGLARGGSASIYDAVTSISLFIENGFDSVLAVFGHTPELTVNSGTNLPPISVQNTTSSDSSNAQGVQGIAVAPSSGSNAGDKALEQQIQQQFSDQVEVHPDQSGTTGVITPVFRDTKGKDFVYVMVPLSSAQTNARTSGNSP